MRRAILLAGHRQEGWQVTVTYGDRDEPLIPLPEMTLPRLRSAVSIVAPSLLPQFFEEMQQAFTQAGDEDSVTPIRMFYRRWAVTVAIERRPSVANRFHAAELAIGDPDSDVRARAIREAGDIVRAAHREVAGG
ncbi:MAG TPA: hypothetical protein VKV02_05980 [Acidobacteriaceae bacterium]|nr:hypothetical protein [Acidobacteriaceae bacterium]